MDYDAIRGGLELAIPFNVHIGLQVVEVGPGRAVVRLPEEPRLLNHVGSQHAGALFSAGEAASGGAFVGAFADLMGDITPLAETADIAYMEIARGPIDAVATLEQDVDALRARLLGEGRVRFPIGVTLSDQHEIPVAQMTVRWYVRLERGTP